MLFKLISGKDVFDLNPELQAINEFANLSAKQMTYVILAVDYKSPFKKLNPTEKKFRAALEAGYPLDGDGKRLNSYGRNITTGKVKAVESAIKKYKVLQRDEDYETILGLSKLVADVRKLNMVADKTVPEIEKAIKFSLDLPKLIKAKKEIEDLLEMREEELPIITSESANEADVQTGELSILAQLMENETQEDDG
jgi:hypothetical protein